MDIRFKVRGYEKVNEFLKTVPRGTLRDALLAITEYIIGDESHGLKHNDPYRYVSRARAYGNVSDAPDGYFSWTQFHYVMARIAKGEIQPGTPNRTGTTSESYYAQETNNGYGQTIHADSPGAYFTRDDEGQARQLGLVGWRKFSKVISDNWSGALRHASAAINAWLKEHGKK